MNIAVVLFGQPRFIELTYKNIIKEFTFDGCKTDFFFHFWDRVGYNSNPGNEKDIYDKDKIVEMYKPAAYEFTNYDPLKEACEEIFDFVMEQKALLKDKNCINHKNIFSISKWEHLVYFLGQFISMKLGFKLLDDYKKQNKKKYDVVFRIRTDLYFVPQINQSIIREKFDHYIYPVMRIREGIVCTPGSLRTWIGFVQKRDSETGDLLTTKPCEDTILYSTEYFKKRFYNERNRHKTHTTKDKLIRDIEDINKPYDGPCKMSELSTVHLKDWILWGTYKSMFTLCSNLLEGLKVDIVRCRKFLNKVNCNYDWGAGELVTGETVRQYKLNVYEIPIGIYAENKNRVRIAKVINEDAKENLFSIKHIVRVDNPKSLDEQILDLNKNER